MNTNITCEKCRVVSLYGPDGGNDDVGGIVGQLCPLHAAAPRMLEALRVFIYSVEKLPGIGYRMPVLMHDAADEARAILRDVEG